MRIIDSNVDFYDFYQNIYRDNGLVFDRRNSYNLSRKEFADCFSIDMRYKSKFNAHDDSIQYILLQICNTFWFFKLKILKTDSVGWCLDYHLKLLASWKDYNAPRELIKLSHIEFPYFIKDDLNKQINAIKTRDYKTERVFNKFEVRRSHGNETDIKLCSIPILKHIGIASEVEPLPIYLAFEEYFAQQKQDSERAESIGLTDKERIENHGFDVKTSFRGK